MEGVASIIISGLIVSALGIKLNALSIENGHSNRTETMLQSNTLTHLGAFFKISLNTSTARTSQLADMLMFMIFKKSSVTVASFPDAVDHALHLVDLLLGDLLMLGKRRHKRWQRSFKLLLYKLVNFRSLHLVLGNQCGYNGVFISQNATFGNQIDGLTSSKGPFTL